MRQGTTGRTDRDRADRQGRPAGHRSLYPPPPPPPLPHPTPLEKKKKKNEIGERVAAIDKTPFSFSKKF